MKAAWRKGLPPTERPLAGRTLAMIFEKPSTRTPRLVRPGDAPARRRDDHADRQGDAARGAASRFPTRRAVLSRFVEIICIRILDHSAMQELAAHSRRADHQRADQALASLPDHGRHPDLRRALRPDHRPYGGVVRRRQQRAGELGARGTALWLQNCGSRRRRVSNSRRRCSKWAAANGADLEVGHDPHAAVAGGRLRRHRLLAVDGRRGEDRALHDAEAVPGQRRS